MNTAHNEIIEDGEMELIDDLNLSLLKEKSS